MIFINELKLAKIQISAHFSHRQIKPSKKPKKPARPSQILTDQRAGVLNLQNPARAELKRAGSWLGPKN